ncbi:RHS repeat domain-containing protein [Aquimarina algiphila]|uniref:RHS repeat domain-containing protein n=1 Tax=Aquimarina algiphila TaxID=2047982 RepID=UPI002491EA86|nr:RHS repeat-associated core domain-containing protein [Aquimarina algiphila]
MQNEKFRCLRLNFNITYIYDATGAKLKKIAPSGSSLIETEYAGNYIYKNGNLEFFNHPEGYATPEGDSYRYVYQFKDHLGNTRLSYTKNDAGILEIIEENNYYPFGLTHKGYNNTVSSLGNSTAQLLKFGGKEEQNELGLGWIDIDARNYDPALGRWMNLDPLADQMRRHSPYNYAFDNPLRFIDPDGMAPFDVIVNGESSKEFVKQLNSSSSLNITRDSETGRVSATGEAVTKADQKLLDAIENTPEITVNVNATSEATLENGKPLLGGAFGGSTINEDGTVDSFQTVDPDIQGGVDKASGRGNGVGALHEVLEGFTEGERALSSGEGSPDSSTPEGKKNYIPAHTAAGNIDPRYSNNPVSIGFSDQSRTKVPGVKETTRTYHVRTSDGSRSPVGKKTFINKRKKRN